MESPRAPEPQSRFNVAQVIAGGIVAASIGWSVWLLRDRPLADEVELLPGTVLSYADLAPVEAALDRAQLTDHRTEEGRIWVPRPRQSAYMRALVEAEALPQKLGSSLHRALKDTSPWQSRKAIEETMRVAVQEELKHVICSMPGIEDASVLSDVDDRGGPDARLGAAPVRTASVNVRTKPDAELQPIQAQTIRVMVAASIAGMTPERVAVVDLRSGVHYAGPVAATAPPAADAGADPELARRAAHERHLAEKVRQALAYVKGAVVNVTVTFPAPVAVAAEPPPREPAAVPRRQRAAAANTPAAVSRPDEPPAEPSSPVPPPAPAPALSPGPESILVSVAVPDAYLQAALIAAREREPGIAAEAGERREEARIREHVLHVLPPTPVPEGRRVVVTSFPSPGSRVTRREPPRPAAGPSPTAASTEPGRRTPGQLLDAAWIAISGGRPGDVPREAWLVAIGIASTLLAWLVLRAGARPARLDVRPRRRSARIDWSQFEDAGAGEEPATGAAVARRIAA